MLERPQKRAAGVDRVVEPAGLECEEEPQVGVLRRDLPRLGGEASRLGDGRRAPRASALNEREGSRDHRHHERRRDDRRAEPRRRRARRRAFLSSRVCASWLALEELAFDARRAAARRPRSSTAAAEARTAVEIGVVASVLLPGASRGRQLPASTELFPILRQPSAQPGPLTDQRLVRDLGRVVVHDQEPGARQLLEHRGRLPAAPRPPGSAPPAGPAFGCPPSSRPAR